MTKNAQISLDGKDVLVILGFAFLRRMDRWTFLTLADVLGLSPSQVHGSVGRLVLSGLLTGKGLNGKVNREALAEFLIYGARYMLPPVFGGRVRGVLTGASSGLFGCSLVLDKNESDCLVWPHATGNSRGTGLVPICPSAPKAALRDEDLYRALAHLDGLRVGRARERDFAAQFFRRELRWIS